MEPYATSEYHRTVCADQACARLLKHHPMPPWCSPRKPTVKAGAYGRLCRLQGGTGSADENPGCGMGGAADLRANVVIPGPVDSPFRAKSHPGNWRHRGACLQSYARVSLSDRTGQPRNHRENNRMLDLLTPPTLTPLSRPSPGKREKSQRRRGTGEVRGKWAGRGRG